jgi:DNA mismatch repair protein MutS
MRRCCCKGNAIAKKDERRTRLTLHLHSGKEFLEGIEARESERTGITSKKSL